MKIGVFIVQLFAMLLGSLGIQAQPAGGGEEYRPHIHFSPKSNWMNDPNGMVYYKGVYHLFFQYYPEKPVWGPMHWGHATSRDMFNWKEQPIALYPDTLGYIFSGSAVVDHKNTSGFGKNGRTPLVAVFTHHVPEKAGGRYYQYQSLAYSLDDGKTWIKYAANPVLKSPGIPDFRDPKVMWHKETNKWIMTLAVQDHISFYSSPDLKNWAHESDFGAGIGAHGGVWECPDLFPLDDSGKKVWILIVNLNPGGPNKGSATQYFMGNFDGKTFSPSDTSTRWLDYGPDEYAGVSWSNTGNRTIFFGWMSNWLYGQEVPTTAWRSAMTIPRELKLVRTGNELLVASTPVKEISVLESKPVIAKNITVSGTYNISSVSKDIRLPASLALDVQGINDFSVVLGNDAGEELVIGFDKVKDQYFIDRTRSGKTDFHKEFAAIHTAPRFSKSNNMDITLIMDVASVELFADGGLTVMTEIFFPNKPFNTINIKSGNKISIKKLRYSKLGSVHK